MGNTATDAIRRELARGESLRAAELGTDALGDDVTSADVELIWLTALALARSGAVERAERLAGLPGLDARLSNEPARLRSDMTALRARLIKDRALVADDEAAPGLALRAAEAYAACAEEFGGYYALINAATMFLFAGDGARSEHAAREVLSLTDSLPSPLDYWAQVSKAEAHLLLRDVAGVAQSLREAEETDPGWGMRSTTRKQLQRICEVLGIGVDVLAALRSKRVVHYTGHMFASGPEEHIAEQIRDLLRELDVGAVYGSLACGADLLMAETALALGVEVHAFLPCPVDEFLTQSVIGGGEEWTRRFASVRERAQTVQVEPTRAVPDEVMFAYCDELAMGHAKLRANRLGCEMTQIAMWDGVPSTGLAGTGAAVRRWRGLGGKTEVVPLDRSRFVRAAAADRPEPTDSPTRTRQVRGIVFLDVKGFSQLQEDQLPAFFELVMGALAKVIAGYDSVTYRNTWGDALYLVFATPLSAAQCALAIQRRMATLAEELGWPGLTARIGGHAGPVYDGFDPVCDEPTHYGTHVTRAARIEPRTPPGQVYITSDFAALLALDPECRLRAEYVGRIPTAKAYGAFPMYVLGG
ncbi:MAG: adenylate/guanylate cyclase domain-containing protein [Deltaproteobacteria bacterium]|nr:adenylate/guanylate cyclase domain-containing protein [Deltaproteobacteria bacterium]